MSQPLIVKIPHELSQEEATRRLKAKLGPTVAQIPVVQVEEEQWVGNCLNFRVRSLGMVVHGTLEIAQDYALLTAHLPWLLAKFANAAKAAIEKKGPPLLEKK